MSDPYAWIDDRLPLFIESARGCWIATRGIGKGGYARCYERGFDRKRHLHVVVWEAFNGAVPEGMELDHKCGVEPCCNPAHVEPVSRQENLIRRNRANGWTRYSRRRKASRGRGA
jgi:hypothetical protein